MCKKRKLLSPLSDLIIEIGITHTTLIIYIVMGKMIYEVKMSSTLTKNVPFENAFRSFLVGR